MDALKIDSEVASDSDKDEFLDILRHGSVGPMAHSAYSRNYAFFSKRMAEMASEWPSYIALFAARILNNVILLPIEAESQDTALRIFSTLNDRGLPLADADIFKSQFYKHFSGEGRKDEFVTRWKALEETANLIFKPTSGTPLDELFTRYMYYRRAKKVSATQQPKVYATSTATARTKSYARTRRSTIWSLCSIFGNGLMRRRAFPSG